MYFLLGFDLPPLPKQSSNISLLVKSRAAQMIDFWERIDEKVLETTNFWIDALKIVKGPVVVSPLQQLRKHFLEKDMGFGYKLNFSYTPDKNNMIKYKKNVIKDVIKEDTDEEIEEIEEIEEDTDEDIEMKCET